MKQLAVLLFSSILFSFSNPNPQPATSTSPKPTIILVHGLWADGSSWSKVIPSLLEQGYKVISVQNPTTTLEEDVAVTQRAIKLAGGDVILVGHSWGGFVITEAGDDPHVKALVYIAAYAPDKGETVLTVSDKAAPTKLTSFLQNTDDFVTLTKDGVVESFANGLPADEQNLIYTVQQPASTNVFKGVASHVAWQQKPSWYVVAGNDHCINPDLERLMAKRANAKTTVVESPHVAMIARPREVVEVILDAARTVSK